MEANLALQILKNVNSFYESAWTKLIIVVSGIFGIIGILMPLVIYYIQNRFFRFEEAQIKTNIQNQISTLKESVIAEISKSIEEKTSSLLEEKTAELAEAINISQGMVFFLQGKNNINSNPNLAFQSYLISSEHFLKTNDGGNIQSLLTNMEDCLDRADFSQLAGFQRKNIDDEFSIFITTLQKKYPDGTYTNYIRDIKIKYEKIKAK